jgi:DNA-binding response OmpR family regulator
MKILIIEDEAAIRTSLVRRLEAEGYSADSAGDGERGLQRALRNDYDLVLLDLTLPGRDGLDVLGELQHQRANLPVLVLSAGSDVATKLRAYELGARDYLLKPFALEELIAHVHAQLWHRNGPRQNVVRAGDLVLDLTQRQARVGDRSIDLSNREFHLLQYLAEHAGDVVGREELLAEVWGESLPSSNVLEACIRRLRAKLGPDAPIRTVRHAGYRLEA